MADCGIRQNTAAGRVRLEACMEQRKELEMAVENGDWGRLRRGWCWGPKTFREEMLELIGQKQGRQHQCEAIRESEEQKAERLVGDMLGQLRWSQKELNRRSKTDKKKVLLARRLRTETAMSWQWIADRLKMGHWRTAANAVRSGAGI